MLRYLQPRRADLFLFHGNCGTVFYITERHRSGRAGLHTIMIGADQHTGLKVRIEG